MKFKRFYRGLYETPDAIDEDELLDELDALDEEIAMEDAQDSLVTWMRELSQLSLCGTSLPELDLDECGLPKVPAAAKNKEEEKVQLQ